jgi:tRNA G18 (ribose-2'-O)-methylase SpoU
VGLDARAERGLDEVEARPPLVICLGAEREGLPEGLPASARIPLRPDGPESLNVAMAATVALYDLGNRMARDA